MAISKFNLERDMKDAAWFVHKVRTSESYAQNLYAALCNNAFQKVEVVPILKDEVWSCTWRYAGGIVADIRCEGSYMDWYCSGIGGTIDENSKDNGYVSESHVTDEIKQDFEKLGWLVVKDYYDDAI